MSANLRIAFDGSRAFEQVHSLHDDVLAVFFSYFKHRALDASFLIECFIVRKQIELIIPAVRPYIVGGNAETAEEQAVVGLCIKLVDQCFVNDLMAVGQIL